jgi:hypothetical protein
MDILLCPRKKPFHEKYISIEILVLEQVSLRWYSKPIWHKKPCKKSVALHPRQGNLPQRNIFTGLSKTSLYNTK